MAGGQSFSNSRTLAQIPDDAALRRTRRPRVWGKTKPTAFTHGPTALLFVGRARRTSGQGEPDRGQHRQAAGVGAPKVIGVLVPMSAFGGKADMSSAHASGPPISSQPPLSRDLPNVQRRFCETQSPSSSPSSRHPYNRNHSASRSTC